MSKTSARAGRVLLSCKHIHEFDPRPEIGAVLYCRNCHDYRTCEYNTVEWHARCITSRCRYSVYYGDDKARAMRGIAKHLNFKPSHTVKAMHGDAEPIIIAAAQVPLIVTQLQS